MFGLSSVTSEFNHQHEFLLNDFEYLSVVRVDELRQSKPENELAIRLLAVLQKSCSLMTEETGLENDIDCVFFPASRRSLAAHLEEYRLFHPETTETPQWLKEDALWHVGLLLSDSLTTSVMINLYEPLDDLLQRLEEWLQDELMEVVGGVVPACPRHPNSHPLQVQAKNATVNWVCPTDSRIEKSFPLMTS